MDRNEERMNDYSYRNAWRLSVIIQRDYAGLF
jgi:hypothetical protein